MSVSSNVSEELMCTRILQYPLSLQPRDPPAVRREGTKVPTDPHPLTSDVGRSLQVGGQS